VACTSERVFMKNKNLILFGGFSLKISIFLELLVFRRCDSNQKMILLGVVAHLLEKYMITLARVFAQVVRQSPFPRRMRLLILRRIPFSRSRVARNL
jgi:hypothetical protein